MPEMLKIYSKKNSSKLRRSMTGGFTGPNKRDSYSRLRKQRHLKPPSTA